MVVKSIAARTSQWARINVFHVVCRLRSGAGAEEANIPYYTRKYLLGHRLGEKGQRGGDVTAIYTHLQRDLVKECHQRVIKGPLAAVLTAFQSRLDDFVAED
jgi:hypothetical protein